MFGGFFSFGKKRSADEAELDKMPKKRRKKDLTALNTQLFSSTPSRACITALLSQGADVNARHPQYGYTLLQHLVLAYDFYGEYTFEAIQCLVENGADLNLLDNWYGLTAFQRALFCVPTEVLVYLLENGADFRIPIKGEYTTYDLLLARREWPVIQKVLHEEPEKGSAIDLNGFTGLHWAVYHKDHALLKKLLAHGGDKYVNVKNDMDGESALYLAVMNDDPVAIKLLCEHGAEPNEIASTPKGKQFYPLLGHAIFAKKTLAKAALLEAGAHDFSLNEYNNFEQEKGDLGSACVSQFEMQLTEKVSYPFNKNLAFFHQLNSMESVKEFLKVFGLCNQSNQHVQSRKKIPNPFLDRLPSDQNTSINTFDAMKYFVELDAVNNQGSVKGFSMFSNHSNFDLKQFSYSVIEQLLDKNWIDLISFSKENPEAHCLQRILENRFRFVDKGEADASLIIKLIKKTDINLINEKTFFLSLANKEVSECILDKLVDNEITTQSMKPFGVRDLFFNKTPLDKKVVREHILNQMNFTDLLFRTLYRASNYRQALGSNEQICLDRLCRIVDNILFFCPNPDQTILSFNFANLAVERDDLVTYFSRRAKENENDPSTLLFAFETLDRLGILEKYIKLHPDFLFTVIASNREKENTKSCIPFLIEWYFENRGAALLELGNEQKKIIVEELFSLNSSVLLDKCLNKVGEFRHAITPELLSKTKDTSAVGDFTVRTEMGRVLEKHGISLPPLRVQKARATSFSFNAKQELDLDEKKGSTSSPKRR